MGEALTCNLCSYSTSDHSNFKRHKKKHEGVENHLKCVQCHYSTSSKFNLQRHQNSHRNDKNLNKAPFKDYACPMCGHVSLSRKDGIQHYVSGHDIVLKTYNLQFNDMEQFFLWKNEFEKETLSKFVIRQHTASTDGSDIKYTFRCHRDGFFKSRSTGKRHLKQIGSNKINTCCPAVIKITADTSQVDVEVVETHVGHKNDVGRLSLTTDEKEGLAAKLAAKINFNVILDEIRENLISCDLSRIDLITRKDLINIAKKFNLTSAAIRDQNDWTSVDSWVKQNDDGAVRFYKPQGVVLDSHSQFTKEDFILVIANDPQIFLLKQYGYDCVCLDGTHGLNQYDFELTTLLVVDNLRQGFPAAFMLSNKADTTFVSVFLESVKGALGVSLKPNVFMSDMSPVYYNAWINVMLPPKHRIFCAWHVDRAWRKNLSKVKGQEKKVSVYKTVRTLLQKSEEDIFEKLIESALKIWEEEPDTADFGKYFKNEYSGNVRQWAYCFRRHLGLNTNMHLESMHKVLKHFYFEGKKVKRLDLCINGLMKFTRDKLFGRLITMFRGKVSSKILALQSRHKRAGEEMENTVLLKNSDVSWTISSRSTPTTHDIEVGDLNCSCDVRCHECNICIHSYKCTCNDSAIKWNICCHIHYLVMREKPVQAEPPQPAREECGDELVVDEENNHEKDVIVQHFFEERREVATFSEKKKEVEDKMLKTLSFAENLKDLKVIENGLAPMIPTMKASREAEIVFHPKRKINTLKKMSPQKTLFSTKNKKKKKDDSSISNPDEEQQVLEAARLLLLHR